MEYAEETGGRSTAKMPARKTRLAVAAFAVAGLIGLQAAPALAQEPLNTQAAAPSKTALQSLPSFADLVEKVSPAVVSIRVDAEEEVQNNGMPDLPFPPGSPFEKFFRDLQPKGKDGKPLTRKARALGSGFIISADGYVVTNNHVVGGEAKEKLKNAKITVIRKNGDELPAKLIGTDPKTDLALIKVEPKKPLPFVKFGDSDGLRVGDWVLAVGNPFGLGGSVTAGIVSARGREIGAGPYDDFIQIDAPINKGNSGGPTFDVHGNVVGVNTAIFSPTGGSVGIGFAIPSAMAEKVVEDLKDDGKVTRGWLGVVIQPVDKDMASSLQLKEPKGALVAQVTKDGPAQKYGVKAGDVILAVNGKKMDDVRDVTREVADLKPDEKTPLRIWRDGREKTITVKIGTYPDNVDLSSGGGNSPQGQGSVDTLGLSLTSGDDGVTVTDVDGDSDAAEKGVRPGDVIVNVSGKDVKKPEDVVSAVKAARDGGKSSVMLLLRNDDQQRFVALSVKEKK